MIKVIDLGLTDYEDVWEYQKKLFSNLIESKKRYNKVAEEYLLLTQHFPVITLGKHADEKNLLVSEEQLKEKNIKTFKIERGGDITCHEPGQLIVYPIIDLENYGLGIKNYVNLLEESIKKLLDDLNIKGTRREGAPGIWIKDERKDYKKICALGIKSSRFCTMHGLALNVNNDLSTFQLINPCGFNSEGVTSIKKELGEKTDIEIIKEKFLRVFFSLIFSFKE